MRNKIKRLFKRSVDSLTKIVIGGATVLCTPGHNIYANDSYIRAADLSPRDSIYTSSGNYERIDDVSTFDTTATVYNIEVEGNHNYFVSGRNLLVHNNCGWLTLKNTEDLSQSTFNQFTNNLINIGPEITVAQRKDFYDAINTLTPAQRSAFLNDFGDNAEALTDFISDLGLVNSWKLIRSTDVETLETFSTLYKNNGFKGYFDDLLSNPTNRKFSDVLSVEEEAVLKYYTTNPGYKDLNKALRGGEGVELTEEFIAQEKLMNKALDKLPNSTYNNSDELLYRIENLTEEQITNLYKKGENYTSKGFYSSTYSEDAVIDAMRNRSHTVLIRIKGKNGKLIEGLSTLPKEKKILFKSGTGFKVDNVGFSPNPDDFMTPIRTVWLTEL